MSEVQCDEAAMMQAWIRCSTPNEKHQALAPLVGEFDAEAKFFMAPDAPPQESTGVSTNQWILGERFVQMDYAGNFCEQEFKGTGLFGYDIAREMYVGTWSDTMTTMIMFHEGPASADPKLIELRGEFVNAVGQTIKDRHVTRIIDNDHHTFDMYHTGPDGKENPIGTIKYTRRK